MHLDEQHVVLGIAVDVEQIGHQNLEHSSSTLRTVVEHPIKHILAFLHGLALLNAICSTSSI